MLNLAKLLLFGLILFSCPKLFHVFHVWEVGGQLPPWKFFRLWIICAPLALGSNC